MTDDIVAFVRARLDEDEAAAREAGGDAWAKQRGDVVSAALAAGDYGPQGYWVASASFACEGEAESLREGHAAHIARHNPARVLREVEAKRAIVSMYESYADAQFPDFSGGYASATEDALAHLAAVWSDHQDYREEWRP